MPFKFNAKRFEADVEADALSLARVELGRFAHRGLEIINATIKRKTGTLNFSVGGNFAKGHNGGTFVPAGTVQRAPPIGLSIDLALIDYVPGDGLSTTSLLKYAHQVGDTFQVAEALLMAEAA